MKKPLFIATVLLTLAINLQADKPNIILVFIDDMGCFEVRHRGEAERAAAEQKHEMRKQTLKRTLENTQMADLLEKHGQSGGKWSRRALGCVVRSQERLEVEAGAVGKAELDD